jgi:putative membrane protein
MPDMSQHDAGLGETGTSERTDTSSNDAALHETGRSTEPHAPSAAITPPREGRGALMRHLAIGFLMGSADVVPGVSGGTIALVGGIYARLIDAIRDGARALTNIARGRLREGVGQIKATDFALLVPLLIGIGVAVVSLASIIERMLEEQPVRLSGLFLGLVLGAVPVAWQLIRRVDARVVTIAVVVAVTMFLVLGLQRDTTSEAAAASSAPVWAYPLSGAIAICAMILPGVSGSFLLVLMDMYDDLLAAVNDREIGLLLLFMAGCVLGLAVFSRVLAWLMDHHHDMVVGAMVGLMLGSVRVLWPWPHGTETTELAAPSGDVAIPALLIAVGFAAVFALGRLGLVKEEAPPNPG